MVSTDQPVIAAGPYRLLRHPSYTGVLLAGLGVGLASANWAGLAGLMVLMVAPLLWRIHIEERPLWPRSATGTAATPWGTSASSRPSGDRNNDCSSKLTGDRTVPVPRITKVMRIPLGDGT